MDGATPVTGIYYLSAPVIGTGVAVLLTIAIYSFLYGDNPLYKFAEHLFVGVSAAYGVALTWHQAIIPYLYQPLFAPEPGEAPRYIVIIPGLLGLLMFSRFFPRYDWLSRWPIAFTMGIFAGMAVPAVVQTDLLPQVQATISPLVPPADGGGLDFHAMLDNVALLAGVVCVLAYFFFSMPHRGAIGAASRVGIWVLMIAFGASFGNTVMARISLLIGRVLFLRYEAPGVFFPP